MGGVDTAHPYAKLTPDRVLDALASVGIRGDGRLLALGSYENRVYQVWQRGRPARRRRSSTGPQRWSDDAIREEHAFVAELAEREIPVVAPLSLAGATLHDDDPFPLRRLSALRRPRARAREPRDAANGSAASSDASTRSARSRRSRIGRALDLETFGVEPRDWLLAHDFIPPDLLEAWRSIADAGARGRARLLTSAPATSRSLRLHGDCHAGNVLWTEHDAGPHFVDFDDARMGPAVQDLWMLLSGDRADDDAAARRRARRLRGVLRASTRASFISSRRCARCASSTTRRGSRSAGTIPRFPRRSRGSTRSATGRTASSSCASRSR